MRSPILSRGSHDLSKESSWLSMESSWPSEESCWLSKESSWPSKESCCLSKESSCPSKESSWLSMESSWPSEESCWESALLESVIQRKREVSRDPARIDPPTAGRRRKAGTILPSPSRVVCLMDRVFIAGLEIETVIGIYDWERKTRQPLVFDIEMGFDNRVPAASDDIIDTLDYKAVSKRLIAFVAASSFGLVETLAERCAEMILAEFPVAQLQLRLSKPGAVRGAQAVGVIIERKRA